MPISSHLRRLICDIILKKYLSSVLLKSVNTLSSGRYEGNSIFFPNVDWNKGQKKKCKEVQQVSDFLWLLVCSIFETSNFWPLLMVGECVCVCLTSFLTHALSAYQTVDSSPVPKEWKTEDKGHEYRKLWQKHDFPQSPPSLPHQRHSSTLLSSQLWSIL